MIQTIGKKLRVPRIPRITIAWLAGASPFILALILMCATMIWIRSHDAGWIKYLVQYQDDIIQSLIVSSIMVAVFSTLLRCKVATFAAGLQPVVIQAMFIFIDGSRHIIQNLPLTAIIVLPLLILLMSLRREISELDDEGRMRRPIDSEKRNTST